MWSPPPPPKNEAARLVALEACGIMDTPPEERFDRLTRLAQRVYNADVAFIGFIDAHHQWMKSVTTADIAPSIERRKSVCQHVVSSGQPLVVRDFRTDSAFEGHPVAPRLPLRFYAGVPIRLTPDLVVGSLCVLRREPAADGEAIDLAALEDIAAIAVDEIELRQMNQALTRLTRIDALTGLANRRGFDEALERAVVRCRRTSEPLSLAMIDIDHFKVVNDTLGHPAGDEALRRLATTLPHAFRRTDDVIARYGGEEFAVIFPSGTEEAAREAGERLRAELKAVAIPHPTRGIVTVSVGIATQIGGDLAAETLIADADAALYAAKRQGRDRVLHRSAAG
ncbi:sensor domain-containing diguanylate cyclase [Ancylobacter sp. A5.8]|uniref:GGDEF domain-containing protein n=1 Tax=Ancylobacter gelatini TaxID=2919920 RepID=UPI001F4EFF99|nr:sensor domain-containing diguanylate cyclase [Ancylobacter gelatini]MCJ8142448.1 sensor domain-containing diguanylate cyclase [Ancylobacter gelatini]